MLAKYLIIGVVVQICIMIWRLCLNKVQGPMKDLYELHSWIAWATFAVTLILGYAINILTWPLAIVAECYNTYTGQ